MSEDVSSWERNSCLFSAWWEKHGFGEDESLPFPVSQVSGWDARAGFTGSARELFPMFPMWRERAEVKRESEFPLMSRYWFQIAGRGLTGSPLADRWLQSAVRWHPGQRSERLCNVIDGNVNYGESKHVVQCTSIDLNDLYFERGYSRPFYTTAWW